MRTVWDGTSKHTQETLLAANNDGQQVRPLDEAQEFLEGLLANGPVAATKAFEAASECGISKRTLERAKRKLNVRVSRAGFGGPWQWSLPEGRHTPSPRSPLPDVAVFGEIEGKVAAFGERGGATGETKATIPPVEEMPEVVQLVLNNLGGEVTSFKRLGDGGD